MTKSQRNLPDVIEAAGGLLWRSTPNGKEIALIHRARYNDWTLPKGKRELGESWIETALREVNEETGCLVQLGPFAGGLTYTVNSIPKVVLYWHMYLKEDLGFYPSAEVDLLLWLAPIKAAQIMSYPAEIEILEINKYP